MKKNKFLIFLIYLLINFEVSYAACSPSGAELAAPKLLGPLHKYTSSTPSFSWTSSTCANRYHIHVSKKPGFIPGQEDYAWIQQVYSTSTTIPSTSSLDEGEYYWRVKSVDQYDNIKYSDPASFTVINCAANGTDLSKPILYSPVDNKTTSTPTLSWSPSSCADRYHVHVSTNKEFSNYIWIKQVYGTSVTIPDTSSLPDGEYFWRVRSVDSNNNSNLSEYRSFTVGCTTEMLEKPIQYSPISGLATSTPTFEWSNATCADRYHVHVSTNKEFSNYIWIKQVYGTSVTIPDTSSLPDGEYFWRVRSVDKNNKVIYSDTKKFLVGCSPTGDNLVAPNLYFPDKNETTSTPKFSWSPSVCANRYHVHVSTDKNFSNYTWVKEVYDTEVTIPINQPLDEGEYYWRVKSVDQYDNIKFSSETKSFIVGCPPGSVNSPTQYNPFAGYSEEIPTFSWSKSACSNKYLVQVSSTSDFLNYWEKESHSNHERFSNMFIGKGGENPLNSVDSLPIGNYYSRVCAVDSFGNLKCSTPASFSIPFQYENFWEKEFLQTYYDNIELFTLSSSHESYVYWINIRIRPFVDMYKATGKMFYFFIALDNTVKAISLLKDVNGDRHKEWPCPSDPDEYGCNVKTGAYWALCAERAGREISGISRLILETPDLSEYSELALDFTDHMDFDLVQNPLYSNDFQINPLSQYTSTSKLLIPPLHHIVSHQATVLRNIYEVTGDIKYYRLFVDKLLSLKRSTFTNALDHNGVVWGSSLCKELIYEYPVCYSGFDEYGKQCKDNQGHEYCYPMDLAHSTDYIDSIIQFYKGEYVIDLAFITKLLSTFKTVMLKGGYGYPYYFSTHIDGGDQPLYSKSSDYWTRGLISPGWTSLSDYDNNLKSIVANMYLNPGTYPDFQLPINNSLQKISYLSQMVLLGFPVPAN